MYPWQESSALRSATTDSTCSWVASAGRSYRIDAMPTSAQSRCLPSTYACDPGSSPTSTVPRPGTMPRSASALTRARRSSFTAAAVALPSRMVAVTAVSLQNHGPMGGGEEPRLGQIDLRAGDVDALQVYPAEIRAAQIGSLEDGVLEPGGGQIGAAQVGPGQVGAHQVGLAQPQPGQLGPGEILPAQGDETPVAAGDGDRPQPALDELGAGQFAVGQRGVEERAPPERRLEDRGAFQDRGVEPHVSEVAV